MSVYLMDFLLKRVRVAAYDSIVAAYRPTIAVRQIQAWLGIFNAQETHSFLKERGAVFVQEDATDTGEAQVDCKTSFANLSA